MKSLITGGLALAIAACIVAPAWSASGVPQGSYLQSCRNVYLDSSSGKPKVYADCPDRQGNWHHSGTQYMKCSGDIANRDGELGCVGQGSGPGPSGGLPDKPVGTVWFAWKVPKKPIVSGVCHFAGDRVAVREQTIAHALEELLHNLG